MASQSGYHDAGSSGRPQLEPGDLPSKRLLGTGVASVGYETELNGKKCARKDFMGVPSGTFRREAARLVRLEDHINVVKTLGWTENEMSCSLVLEYMDDDLLGFLQKRKQSQGRMEAGPNSGNQSDLDSRNTIKLGPFELPEALDVMLQIARGMEHLADKGIRHGNLKTKNVLVTRDGSSLSVKVADFGLVRTRRKSTSFSSRQARKLDMARWTSPETLEVFLLEDKGETSSDSDSDEDCTDSSDVADSDVPEWRELVGADVYSFAVTCSQILTGEDPYPNLNWKQLGVNIVRHGLTPTLPAACPPELRELLVSCWGCDPFCRYLYERPSISSIRRTLERLQQLDLPAQNPHESLPLAAAQAPTAIKRKAPTDITRKALMDIKRKALMNIKRKAPTNIKRKEDALRQPMPGKEPTDVVREIGLREPLTVEDLWGTERLQQHAAWRLDPLARPDPWARFGRGSFPICQILVLDVASLITSTRTMVRHRAEWTQLREELELMIPDLLKIRNRWCSFEAALDAEEGEEDVMMRRPAAWSIQLGLAVLCTLLEVLEYQQQEDDPRSLLSSLSAAITEPRRVSKLRNDWKQLAKQRKQGVLGRTTQSPSTGKREGEGRDRDSD